jgi:hypothetical protein
MICLWKVSHRQNLPGRIILSHGRPTIYGRLNTYVDRMKIWHRFKVMNWRNLQSLVPVENGSKDRGDYPKRLLDGKYVKPTKKWWYIQLSPIHNCTASATCVFTTLQLYHFTHTLPASSRMGLSMGSTHGAQTTWPLTPLPRFNSTM